jgi:hypothetical protein
MCKEAIVGSFESCAQLIPFENGESSTASYLKFVRDIVGRPSLKIPVENMALRSAQTRLGGREENHVSQIRMEGMLGWSGVE